VFLPRLRFYLHCLALDLRGAFVLLLVLRLIRLLILALVLLPDLILRGEAACRACARRSSA
jgi:hypothetical protein